MPPPTADQTWPPASPAQLASALLASLQRVTSSARLLLIGCFQCEFFKAGCWRRQEEQDGAWFDCNKLQVEHPYCYVNPVALSEATSTTALCHPSLSHLGVSPRLPSPGGPCKTSPQRSPGSALAPRGLGTQPAASPPKRHKKLSVNGGHIPEREGQDERVGDAEEDTPLKDSVALKDGAARYVRSQGGRTPLVESFADKLEADVRRLEYDRQRAEGEVVETTSSDTGGWLGQRLSPKGCGSADSLPDASSTYPYDEPEDSPYSNKDVFTCSELEDVFECFNTAAFYSYGAAFPAGEKFTSKARGEKFEEVFPVSTRNNSNNNNNSSSSSNNNNNNNNVHKPLSDGESHLQPGVPDKGEAVTENLCETNRKQEFSQDQLEQFIDACVLAESVAEVDEKCPLNDKDGTKNCRNVINFCGKGFNKLLIFNLVKSTMSECVFRYPRSLPLCTAFPAQLVQSKVMKMMLEENTNEENQCGLQVFHSPTLLTQRERQVARRLVEGVATAEMRAEDRQWQDFNKEEQEMKEAIFSEILHDLISDTANVFEGFLVKKLLMSQESKGD